jgi:hypothetical protein
MLPRPLPRLWLGPWRHPIQEHLSQGPDVIGQPRRHRGCTGPLLLGRTRTVGGLRLWQRLTDAGMRQAKVVIRLIQHQLLAQAVRTFAQRADPSSHRCHMLADAEVEPLTSQWC